MHSPIQIFNLAINFGHKICFSNFSYVIYPGKKIAIIGDNGSGKSSLLKLIANLNNDPIDDISGGNNIICGYVPQIINDFTNLTLQVLSGGQRFNKVLSAALANSPNMRYYWSLVVSIRHFVE